MNITAALDLLLGLTCALLAWLSAKQQRLFLATGFMWIALAATAGAIRFAGYGAILPTHTFLSKVSSSAGMLLLAVGTLATLGLRLSSEAFVALLLSALGASVVHHFFDHPKLDSATLVVGVTLLVALFFAAIAHLKRSRYLAALTAFLALASFLFIPLGLPRLPTDLPLARVDILHLALTMGYLCTWHTNRR